MGINNSKSIFVQLLVALQKIVGQFKYSLFIKHYFNIHDFINLCTYNTKSYPSSLQFWNRKVNKYTKISFSLKEIKETKHWLVASIYLSLKISSYKLYSIWLN